MTTFWIMVATMELFALIWMTSQYCTLKEQYDSFENHAREQEIAEMYLDIGKSQKDNKKIPEQ